MPDTILSTTDGHVATITINDPERRNPLSAPTLQGLRDALHAAKINNDVRVVIITGAGDKAFSAGADLTSMSSGDQPTNRDDLFVEIFTTATTLGKPIIGAINGHALAGGFGLALTCDILIASEKATFGTPEIRVGVWPMMIMSIITRNLGRKRALDLFMTGRRIDAQTAHEWGLVSKVVPQQDVMTEATSLANEIAGWSPAVMRLGRNAFYAIDGMPYEQALHYLQAELGKVLQTEDAKEGVRAFLEKRAPNFSGK